MFVSFGKMFTICKGIIRQCSFECPLLYSGCLQKVIEYRIFNKADNKVKMSTFLTEEVTENEFTIKNHKSRTALKVQKKDIHQNKFPSHNNPSVNSNPDIFGTIRSESLLRKRLKNVMEEDDEKFIEYINDTPGKTRLSTFEYSKLIIKFLDEKKLKEAIDVLEVRMKNEKVRPDEYIFRLVISGCAKVGYTKKAFQLFNQMKKRALKIKPAVYTSLFDACANSPWQDDCSNRVIALWDLMEEKNVKLNQQIAHAAIKAYGRCGQIERAFALVDEMSSQEVPISSETMNFLLQACASEKEAGFRHALMVWRKMYDKKLIPTTYTFNLMLRCVRDCFVGDAKSFNKDLSTTLIPSQEELINLITPSDRENSIHIRLNQVESEAIVPCQPTNESYLTSFIDVRKFNKPWNRLMILGGRQGFLDMMLKTGAKPDIKTFTQLLFIIPPNTQEEEFLMAEMKQFGIKMDLDFCNMLIKKRNINNNPNGAREILNIIRQEQLVPNIVTFGVLALGCSKLMDIKILIKDIKAMGFRLNIVILGTLLNAACRSWNFKAIKYLVDLLIKYEVKPDLCFIQHLDKLEQDILTHIDLKKKGSKHCALLDYERFDEDYEDFQQLVTYVKSLEIEDPSMVHPWHQFKG